MSKAIEGAAMLGAAVADGAAMALLGSTGVGMAAMPYLAELMKVLVIGGIAMEAGAVADALTQNRGMGITTRQPAAFRQIIYGEQRVGGIIVYESTTGGHFDQYNYIIVLAGHEIDSIVNLYLDGRQVFWDGSNTNGNTTRNGVNFGGNATGGTQIGPGGQHYNFDTLVYCEARFGDQLPGDVIAGMTANDPNWAAGTSGSPWLGGCAYVYLKVEYDTSMFPQMPEIKFTVRGKNNIFDPRLTAPPTLTVLERPTTLLNGWGNNAHVGAYEEGVDQGYGWGLNNDTTYPYTNPGNAFDGDPNSAASCLLAHTHEYAGCIWSFAGLGATPSALYLNVLSEVQPISGAARSAGIWYSLDGGTTWTQIYNAPYRAKAWDSIPLSPTQDASQVQVMAFVDAHDDMDQYVYDVQLATGPQNSQSQNGYSTNWALIVADVLTDPVFGLGDASVNQAQLIAAANVCDEQVTLAIGGTESRYCAHWHYDTATAPGDALDTLMPTAAGRLSRIGGEWYIWPAYWQGPSFTFDESTMTGPLKWTPYRSFRELVNCVNGTYIAANSPYNVAGNLYDANGWYDGSIANQFPFAFQPTNYPQYAQDVLHGYTSNQWLIDDGGVTLPKEVTQRCVLSVAQAQRCAKIYLLRNRQQGSGSFPMALEAWQMQPLDVMQFTFAVNGWTDKQLEIVSTSFRIDVEGDNSAPSVRAEFGVQETDESVYEWSTSEELSVYDVPANPTQGSPYTITPPSGLVLVSDAATAVLGADGVNQPRILATWVAPGDVRVTQIDIQYKLASSGTWIDVGLVNADVTSIYIPGVVSGDLYDVQIASVTAAGAMSVWVGGTVTAEAPNSLQNIYSNNPAIALTQPTATTVAMVAVAVTFGATTVNYAARTVSIPTPTVPTWYYFTIADPEQQGESGSPTLTATCQTSTALCGVEGNTYMGAIQALPGGGATLMLAGGWPAPPTYIVGS